MDSIENRSHYYFVLVKGAVTLRAGRFGERVTKGAVFGDESIDAKHMTGPYLAVADGPVRLVVMD